jgi:methyl-accepting chemotaxis protein
MKNRLLKSIIVIALIVLSAALAGCAKITFKVQEEKETTPSKIVSTSSSPEVNKVEINLEELQTQETEELGILSEKLSKADDVGRIKEILEQHYNAKGSSIESVYFAKESGEFYIFPEQSLTGDYDARKRPWYIGALENKEYISEVYKDIVTRRDNISFARSVSREGNNIGVVGIGIIIDNWKK